MALFINSLAAAVIFSTVLYYTMATLLVKDMCVLFGIDGYGVVMLDVVKVVVLCCVFKIPTNSIRMRLGFK